MRRLLPILTVAAALVAAGPVTAAGTGKCHSSGQRVITVDQVVIYLKDVYVGCYTKTGLKTRLVSRPGYDPFAVFAHGSPATVLDAPPGQPAPQRPPRQGRGSNVEPEARQAVHDARALRQSRPVLPRLTVRRPHNP